MVASKPAKLTTTMASFLVPLIIVVVFHPLLCSNSKTHHDRMLFSSTPALNAACRATQLPQLCKSSLSNLPSHATPQQIISAAMELSSATAKHSHLLSKDLLAASWANANVTAAARNCVEFLEYSMELIAKSKDGETEQGIKDVKAWMSAALAYEYDCASDLRYVNTSNTINAVIESVDYATNLSSNALSMVDALDIYGTNTALWRPPSTERSSTSHNRLLGYTGFRLEGNEHIEAVPDVTVSKEQGASVSSIQAAVDAAPDYSARKFVIHIRAGVYEETVRIPRSKTNLVFIGEGMERTFIRGSRYVPSLPGAVTVYDSATVGVNGDGFVARDLTFENTYEGPKTHQAVALRVDSDLSAFYRCAFLSHQDTLYARTLRQFYKNCTIKGTHDFIFGNAAAVFHKCSIRVRPRQLKSKSGEKDPITAQGRTDPAQSTGFVFDGCSVDGTEDYMKDFRANPSVHRVYLGRPWKMYSRTVFLNSYLGSVLRPEGWMAWNGSFALDTLFYGEFGNHGPGADISERVSWCNQISQKHVGMYSVQSFIQGQQWLPSTQI
uniref:pectinesterase n=1 Tax=Cunninghamia lanceolata TaxID=28977 RepID=A0A6G9W3G6_CUNLA|nr:pectin methylesterase 13 [Cunninghamia lanceolata]